MKTLNELFNSKSDSWIVVSSSDRAEYYVTFIDHTFITLSIFKSKKSYNNQDKKIIGNEITIEFSTYNGNLINDEKNISDFDKKTIKNMMLSGSTHITSGGNATKILSAVIHKLKEYVDKNKPLKIVFSGSKDGGRVTLYSKISNMVSKKLSNYTFTALQDGRDNQVNFALYRNDLMKLKANQVTKYKYLKKK